MAPLSKEQVTSRARTLLIAFLLSAPGPLVTGMAVFTSHSTTQLADFIRRTVELLALFVSWWIFRQIHRNQELSEASQKKMERTAGVTVAAAMVASAIAMLIVAISRLSVFEPGGNVSFGLIIAILGMMTNGWFWWRYTIMNREQYSAVIAAQQQLYRAKASVDLCVVAALAAVAIAPVHPATRYVDIVGSLTVSGYLLWTGLRMAYIYLKGGLDQNLLKFTWLRSKGSS